MTDAGAIPPAIDPKQAQQTAAATSPAVTVDIWEHKRRDTSSRACTSATGRCHPVVGSTVDGMDEQACAGAGVRA
ncbi:hypothetical protein Mame01_07070 [Microbispora amethystogenes]|nr:hypothetical protein Mame01_07070 [Microbispora amethystogenes]